MTSQKGRKRVRLVVMYHVTPVANLESIFHVGLIPKQGKVWLCERDALKWAISHISAHHDVATNKLSVIKALVNFNRLTYVGGPIQGRYICLDPIPSYNLSRQIQLEVTANEP